MIKYLEIPDFHFAPEWSDISEQCAEAVRLAAIENKVDFIALPGDLFDKPLYATDRSKYDVIQKIVKGWLDVCPVVAIEGTPSHDAIGCYGPLEEMGLVLLKPNKVYGYTHILGVYDIKYNSVPTPDCILFGIPELRKDNIHTQLSLSADEANAEAVNLVSQYIQEFVGPMRLKYKEIPAIGLLHGNVSDSRQENSTDIIIRASDIVIHTEILEQANLDRWSLGHFHIPWESEKISAGYAGYPGIDSNPWGKRDFVPAMNMVEIDSTIPDLPMQKFDVEISRIPYGTPMRVKVDHITNAVPNPNIAYWIVSEEEPKGFPEEFNIHPWSRHTFPEQIIETRRVTKEQADEAKTLWDMFKLIDPEVNPDLKEKVDSIPVPRNSIAGNKLDARLTYVQVTGCDLFGGKTVEFDLNNLATGMNQLVGTNGNGDGKSSLLGMCSLYPCVVGKDTKSGRRSALKDFFSGQESMIQKIAVVNGHEHNHLITIKGAHTQTPKTECYLTIDGVPQLEKATFDTMMEKCEELYGNYEDYLLTTFYEQPQQSRNQRSGLMTATMTEARNLVQNIAGIDREKEKRYALDQVAECEKTEQQLQSDIGALEKYSEDTDKLNYDLGGKIHEIKIKSTDLEVVKTSGTTIKQKIESLQIRHTENEKAKEQIHQKEVEMSRLQPSIIDNEKRISNYQSVAESLKDNQAVIKKDDKAMKLELDYSNLLNDYNKIISDHERAVIEQGTIRTEQQAIIDNAETTKRSYNKEIELISEPCENCGYIKPDVQENIDSLNNSITLLDESIKMSFGNIETLQPIIEPEKIEPIKPPESLDIFDRQLLQSSIEEGLKAETAIEELQTARRKDITSLESCKKELSEIVYDPEIYTTLNFETQNLSTIRNQYTDIKTNISTLEAEKKAIEDRLQKAKEGEQELKDKQKALIESESSRADWNYIQKMLNPDKIPALELDIILDSIDAEATRNIEPFLEGRYSFHTETQSQGNKKSVDRFDVMIHDAETGQSFSMFYTNPGNKAFYSDCYIKSLIRKRNERQMRSYSPIIYDEADGPVNPIRVKAYYDIQQAYFQDEKVLIVSQKDISAAYVEKVFNIEEMKS